MMNRFCFLIVLTANFALVCNGQDESNEKLLAKQNKFRSEIGYGNDWGRKDKNGLVKRLTIRSSDKKNLKGIGGLSELTEIRFSGRISPSDEELKELSENCQKIKIFALAKIFGKQPKRYSRKGLEFIRKLDLWALFLVNQNLTNDELKCFDKFTNLRGFVLIGKLDDSQVELAFSFIGNMEQLEFLTFVASPSAHRKIKISENAIMALSRLKKLKTLTIDKDEISGSDLKLIKQALPNCEVKLSR